MPALPKYVDYKNTEYLNQFLTAHARIVKGDTSDVPTSHQRKIASAVKRARFMALIPFIAR